MGEAKNGKFVVTDIPHEKYPFLHRIRALRNIGHDVKKDDLGGFVEGEYYELMCEARPEYAEQHGDRAKEIALLTHELRYWGCGRIAVELAKLKSSEALPEPVRMKLSRVIRELTRYKDAVGPLPGRGKAKTARPQER